MIRRLTEMNAPHHSSDLPSMGSQSKQTDGTRILSLLAEIKCSINNINHETQVDVNRMDNDNVNEITHEAHQMPQGTIGYKELMARIKYLINEITHEAQADDSSIDNDNINEITHEAPQVTIEYKDDPAPPPPEPDSTIDKYTTDWSAVREQSKWFTEPGHLTENGTRKSETLETSAIEEYVRTLEKLDNLREQQDKMTDSYDLSSPRSRDDLQLSRSYRTAAEELEIEDLEDRILESQIWSEAAPRPSFAVKETPYRSQINALRLKSLRLEEKRLLEVRRLQELERLRGPRPKWYELKGPQFHVEARKNNEILAAKKQWATLRDYTEDTWKSRDLTRSVSFLN